MPVKTNFSTTIMRIAASLLLTLLLLTVSVLIVLSLRPLYRLYRGELDNPLKLSETVIDENYDRLIDYVLFGKPERLEFRELDMSPEGRQHFVEVRELIRVFALLPLFALPVLLLLLFGLKKKREWRFLRDGARLALSLPVLLALPLLLDFNTAFTAFHKVFFRNDYWIFDPRRDPIILYLPQDFFMKMGFTILTLLVLFSLICLWLYGRLRRREQA